MRGSPVLAASRALAKEGELDQPEPGNLPASLSKHIRWLDDPPIVFRNRVLVGVPVTQRKEARGTEPHAERSFPGGQVYMDVEVVAPARLSEEESRQAVCDGRRVVAGVPRVPVPGGQATEVRDVVSSARAVPDDV